MFLKTLTQVGVHHNGDWTIVHQSHLHIGSEHSCFHLFAKHLRQTGNELLVHGHCEIGFRGPDVTGSVALTRAGHQRELAHQQYATPCHFGDGRT